MWIGFAAISEDGAKIPGSFSSLVPKLLPNLLPNP
jgi:hypothetical protein